MNAAKAWLLFLAVALLWVISLEYVYTLGYKDGIDFTRSICLSSTLVRR